jgi:hypothetical protein
MSTADQHHVSRIEGNRTSILDAVLGDFSRRTSSRSRPFDEGVQEILNIHEAIEFIEEHRRTSPINHAFIRERHQLVVQGLSREATAHRAHTVGDERLCPSEERHALFSPCGWSEWVGPSSNRSGAFPRGNNDRRLPDKCDRVETSEG